MTDETIRVREIAQRIRRSTTNRDVLDMCDYILAPSGVTSGDATLAEPLTTVSPPLPPITAKYVGRDADERRSAGRFWRIWWPAEDCAPSRTGS